MKSGIEQKLSRRQAGSLLVRGLLASLVVGVTAEPVVTPARIRSRFGVTAVSIRDLYQTSGVPYPEEVVNPFNNLAAKNVPSQWSPEQLQVLEQCLQALPPHFSEPNEKGEELVMALSERDCFCPSRFDEADVHRLDFAYNRFNPSTRKEDLSVVAHEATHLIMPVTGGYQLYSEVSQRDVSIDESPWFEQMDAILGTSDQFDTRNILGRRYREKSRSLFDRVGKIGLLSPENQKNLLKESFNPAELESYHFFLRMGDVIGRPYKGLPEFIAFLSENYIKGRPYFDKHVGGIFDKTEYQKVYDFTKQEIFRGKEYPRHPFDVQTH